MDDSLHHKQLRHELVEQVRGKGIQNEEVLAALATVPRHLFIDAKLPLNDKYEDVPLAIGQGQTISQPYTVAFQTQLLDVHQKDRILEIGTGSGYQSAVLSVMGAEVFTIERQEKLFHATKKKLNELGYGRIHAYYGDGFAGLPQLAPFDKIIITAAAPEIPHTLISQLKISGIMVVPVDGRIQQMLRITKISENEIRTEEMGKFIFVPMLPGVE